MHDKVSARFIDIRPTLDPILFQRSPVLAEVMGQYSARTQRWGVMIREHNPYLLLGPKDRRLPHLDEAIRWATEQGYPVFMRVGGGSVVLLDRQCLSFAVSMPCRDLTVWEQNFRIMAQPVIDALTQFGVACRFGRAEGSYCEGPYDLVTLDGQKISGIAQAIRGGSALVSGMILVKQDPVRTTALIQEFYRRAGSSQVLRDSVVTAIDRLPGFEKVSIDDVHDALIKGFSQTFDLAWQPFTPEEWDTAANLVTGRLVADITNKETSDAYHY
ncbi:MAG: lipoate--protein ligase family protein [Sulfobacillus thermotolerans]|uniref:Ligase n=1 Tax=Sulfobacillus thermotolerans TaxID=338644 RepID=A0ABM6RPR7_9FIRM|nr:ligase [Sulfobacillus thermotolerans]MCY0907347.1 lipoate--protein ligase family protein [Sulfobacillus thermotolerans]